MTDRRQGPCSTYAVHDCTAAAAHADAVWALYDEVFGDVEHPETWQTSMWEPHRTRTGFRLATAYDVGTMCGFGWCYVGDRGQYWPDLVVEALPRGLTDLWVGDHLELVELAVDPDSRGAGIGGRLHDLLMAERGHRRALLGTTADEADPAVLLYRARGWQTLGRLSTRSR